MIDCTINHGITVGATCISLLTITGATGSIVNYGKIAEFVTAQVGDRPEFRA